MNPEISREPQLSREEQDKMKYDRDASFTIYSHAILEKDPKKALKEIEAKLAVMQVDLPSEVLRDHMAKLREEIEALDESPN